MCSSPSYVDVFRTLPQLVVIIFIYFGLPYAGLRRSRPSSTTVLALGAVLSAFAAEIFWSAIMAVPRGQWDAAAALGLQRLSTMVLRHPAAGDPARHPVLTNRASPSARARRSAPPSRCRRRSARRRALMAIVANPSPLTLAAALLSRSSSFRSSSRAGDRSAFRHRTLRLASMQLFIENFVNLDSLLRIYPLLLQGLQLHDLLAVVALPLAIALGPRRRRALQLHIRWLNIAADGLYRPVQVFPVVVLLILIFYGLPFLGLTLGGFTAAVLAIVLNNSGYYGEIFRAGSSPCPQARPRPPGARPSRRCTSCSDHPAAGDPKRARAAREQFAGTRQDDLRSPRWWHCPNCCAQPASRRSRPTTRRR